MKSIADVQLPGIGQTIVIKENFGKKKFRKFKCTVEAIYNSCVLVELEASKTRESFTKVDFYTGCIEYENCV